MSTALRKFCEDPTVANFALIEDKVQEVFVAVTPYMLDHPDRGNTVLAIRAHALLNETSFAYTSLRRICIKLATRKIPKERQEKWREAITNKLLEAIEDESGVQPTPENLAEALTSKILRYMTELYNGYFFEGRLLDGFVEAGCTLSLCWKDICADVAGQCVTEQCVGMRRIQIELGKRTFTKAFELMTRRGEFEIMTGGSICSDVLTCVQLTFEHELVHAILSCFCPEQARLDTGLGGWRGGTDVKGGHTQTFMAIVSNTFGQYIYTHQMYDSSLVGKHAEFMGKHLAIGDPVYFPAPADTPTWKEYANRCSHLRGTELCGEESSCVWDPNQVIGGANGCVPALHGVVRRFEGNKAAIATTESNYEGGYNVSFGHVHWDRRHPDWSRVSKRVSAEL